jgi:alanine racemase
MPLSTTRITVDLDALAHNLGVLRTAAGSSEVSAVVKADGYGLGIAPVGRRLRREGVTAFFVARLSEGEALREAIGAPAAIYVLDGLTAGDGGRMAAANLIPVISSPEQADAARCLPGPLALQVDTGMNRQGLSLEDTRLFAADPALSARTGLVMSHLGSADSPADPRNATQLALFREARALFPGVTASLAASAGIFLGADYGFDLVRPGISLYGGGPCAVHDPALRTVVTLEAPLIDIRRTPAGALVGSGDSVVLEQATRIGIVAAGYADGVIRAGRNGGYAFAGGARRRLLIVNMDVVAIDLGDAQVQLGDPIELLGPNALLDDQAAAAGTVAHECLVRLSARADRRYLGAV